MAKEVLEEIPRQICSYFKRNNISLDNVTQAAMRQGYLNNNSMPG